MYFLFLNLLYVFTQDLGFSFLKDHVSVKKCTLPYLKERGSAHRAAR